MSGKKPAPITIPGLPVEILDLDAVLVDLDNDDDSFIFEPASPLIDRRPFTPTTLKELRDACSFAHAETEPVNELWNAILAHIEEDKGIKPKATAAKKQPPQNAEPKPQAQAQPEQQAVQQTITKTPRGAVQTIEPSRPPPRAPGAFDTGLAHLGTTTTTISAEPDLTRRPSTSRRGAYDGQRASFDHRLRKTESKDPIQQRAASSDYNPEWLSDGPRRSDAEAAKWMAAELERRQYSGAQGRPPSRASRWREYIRPSSSRGSLRGRTSRADSNASEQPPSGSWWRGISLSRKNSSGSLRSTTSMRDLFSAATGQHKNNSSQTAAVDLNRALPPLPSLDTYQPKPKHVAQLMRAGSQQAHRKDSAAAGSASTTTARSSHDKENVPPGSSSSKASPTSPRTRKPPVSTSAADPPTSSPSKDSDLTRVTTSRGDHKSTKSSGGESEILSALPPIPANRPATPPDSTTAHDDERKRRRRKQNDQEREQRAFIEVRVNAGALKDKLKLPKWGSVGGLLKGSGGGGDADGGRGRKAGNPNKSNGGKKHEGPAAVVRSVA